MPTNPIYIKRRRYWYYDTYFTREKAIQAARLMRKLYNSRYYIVPTENYWTAQMYYLLYLDNVSGGFY
jgi:hypothetical protein